MSRQHGARFTLLILLSLLHTSMVNGQTLPSNTSLNVVLTDGLIRDPNTGLEFRKVSGISGTKDVIDYNYNSQHVHMSPNGKFLLYFSYIIPVGDGDLITLVDFPANRSVWSPDGKKIAFYSKVSCAKALVP